MGGRLALARADVTTPEGELIAAQVHVIGSTLRLLNQRGTMIVEHEGVDRLDRLDQLHWRIVMTNGTAFAVTRKKGCNCGGR